MTGPEGHLTKVLGYYGPERSFFFYQITNTKMHFHIYKISEPSLLPFTGTDIGLRADALVPCFLLAT